MKRPFSKASSKSGLASAGSAVVLVDRAGACRAIFPPGNEKTAGASLAQVFALGEEESANFALWLKSVFSERLAFGELVPLCPLKSWRGGERAWGVSCRPVRGDDGKLEGVLVIASEGEIAGVAPATVEGGEPVAKLVRLASGRTAFRLFIAQVEELLADLASRSSLSLEEYARRLHTAKSGAASFAMETLAKKLHEIEGGVALARAGRLNGESIGTEIAEMVPDLRAALNAERKSLRDLLFLLVADVAAPTAVPGEARPKDSPQAVSIGSVFGHQEIALRELAESLGKKLASFEIQGGEIEVSSRAQRALAGALIHALRNSIYHGIEKPAERKKARKPEGGKIVMKFARAGTAARPSLKIEISDDGRGVDLAKVRELLEEGDQPALASAEDEVVVQALLEGALSTAAQPGLVAGRGLGLSAIAAEVGRMDGTIRLESTKGRGLKIEIEIPIAGETSTTRAA